MPFEFLLYDVTSTDFEGQALANAKAARGHSRDPRPDCKPVNRGRVVPPDGWPIGSESFAGHTAEVTPVAARGELMERKYGQAQRLWGRDRGLISEANLEFLRARPARYRVGTPQSQVRQFATPLLEPENGTEGQAGVEVKRVAHPAGGHDEQ